MKLDTLMQKKAQEEQDLLDLMAEDYRPALTVQEIKVESGVRGLGHQGTGYSLETIRLALARLRGRGKVRGFGRRLGKQKRTLMWASKAKTVGRDGYWDALTADSAICEDLGIPEYGRVSRPGDQSPGCRDSGDQS